MHRFDAGDHLLVLVVHNIACDGWSGPTRRAPLDVPTPEIQYAAVAAWEQSCADSGAWTGVLDPALVQALDAVGGSMDATPFMTMFAGAPAALHLLTGHGDLTIATLAAGRSRREAADLVGPFTNVVPAPNRCGLATAFDALLGEVRGQMLDAFAHQEVRFDALLQRMRASFSPIARPSRGWKMSGG